MTIDLGCKETCQSSQWLHCHRYCMEDVLGICDALSWPGLPEAVSLLCLLALCCQDPTILEYRVLS